MFNDFIYSHSIWLWGSLLVTVIVIASCIGLAIANRFVGVDLRRRHNDLAGFIVAVVSVTYAVLLAFIAIATWEAFTAAQGIVETEASLVSNMYRDTEGLPSTVGVRMRANLRDYVDTVVETEWPIQQQGQLPSEAWAPLHKLNNSLATLRPADAGEAVIQAELLKTLNELYSARSHRLVAVQDHLPGVMWAVILVGGTITIGFTYLFGFHDFRLHLVMTSAVSASLALIVVLILAMDWPLRGELSVPAGAFEDARGSWADLPFDKIPPGEQSSTTSH